MTALTAARAAADYAAAMDRFGEDIIVRRYSGPAASRTHIDTTVRARVMDYQPTELVGGIVQGDIKVIALVDTLSSLLPLTTNDRLVIRGKEVSIKGVDDNTRRLAGTLIALEIRAEG